MTIDIESMLLNFKANISIRMSKQIIQQVDKLLNLLHIGRNNRKTVKIKLNLAALKSRGNSSIYQRNNSIKFSHPFNPPPPISYRTFPRSLFQSMPADILREINFQMTFINWFSPVCLLHEEEDFLLKGEVVKLRFFFEAVANSS